MPNGTGVETNALKGVSVLANGVPSQRIGVPGQKPNVVSGNVDDVVMLAPARVQGNLIGTVDNGKSAIGAFSGTVPEAITSAGSYTGALLYALADTAQIGGTQPGFGNVISGGQTTDGVATSGIGITAKHITVQGNDIGVGNDATTAVPNSGAGINVGAGGADLIGAPAPGGTGTTTAAGGNIIADNTAAGVTVAKNASAVQILSNQIHDNGAAAISLTDATSNAGISAPAFTAAAQDAHGHTIAILSAPPGSTVQLYTAANCTTGNPGQGAAVLATGTADPAGNASVALPLQAVGTELDATATTATGTSAFSRCTAVAPAADGTVTHPDGQPGDLDTADGTGFTPGESVQGTVHSTSVSLGTQTADGNGDVSFAFHIPASLEAGQHYVLLTGQSSGNTIAIPLTVYTAPSPPRSLTAHAGKHEVTLTWTTPADTGGKTITGYRLQRSTEHGWTTLHTGTARTYIDHAVTGGHSYHYRVLALNSIDASPPSSTASATPYTPPSAPRAVHAKAGHDSVTLTWSAPENGVSGLTR